MESMKYFVGDDTGRIDIHVSAGKALLTLELSVAEAASVVALLAANRPGDAMLAALCGSMSPSAVKTPKSPSADKAKPAGDVRVDTDENGDTVTIADGVVVDAPSSPELEGTRVEETPKPARAAKQKKPEPAPEPAEESEPEPEPAEASKAYSIDLKKIPKEISGAMNIRTAVVFLYEKGLTEADDIVAELQRCAEAVPYFGKVKNLKARVEGTLELM